MTNTPRTMQLAPAHWRQLALLNVEQLHQFISSIPPVTEAGQSAMTDEAMAVIERHLAEQGAFLRAWRVARLPRLAVPKELVVETTIQRPANGHAPTKRRGGWPRGKPRKPRAEAVQ